MAKRTLSKAVRISYGPLVNDLEKIELGIGKIGQIAFANFLRGNLGHLASRHPIDVISWGDLGQVLSLSIFFGGNLGRVTPPN